MKTKIILGAAVVAIIATAGGYLGIAQSHKPKKLSELQMANIDALVSDEGTPVGTCYTRSTSGNYCMESFCDSQTTQNMIYPCESSSFGWRGTASMCTK